MALGLMLKLSDCRRALWDVGDVSVRFDLFFCCVHIILEQHIKPFHFKSSDQRPQQHPTNSDTIITGPPTVNKTRAIRSGQQWLMNRNPCDIFFDTKTVFFFCFFFFFVYSIPCDVF
jgi:hypothetical protein